MRNRKSNARGFIAGLMVAVMLSGTIVLANPVTRELFFGVTVTLNGENVEFDDDSQPFIIEGRTFLPVGAFSRTLGFEVEWDSETSTVDIVAPALAVINPITPAEIAALQTAWGDGLVAISTAYAEGEDYAAIAQAVLDNLYGFVDGIVLFKPTIASEVPFRFTEADAASYFIGGNISEDSGFALLPWTAVRFCENGMYIINGETALWMGSVYLTDGNGEVIRVEKTLGLYRDASGNVRIQLHHSSVPFTE